MSRSKRILMALGVMLGIALVATEAQARAPACGGPTPAVGDQIKGPVLHVIDGQRLCVAVDASPTTWVELQLDAGIVRASDGGDAKARLMAAAFARNAVCVITGRSGGRATAACTIEGESLSARLNQPAVTKAAQAWR